GLVMISSSAVLHAGHPVLSKSGAGHRHIACDESTITDGRARWEGAVTGRFIGRFAWRPAPDQAFYGHVGASERSWVRNVGLRFRAVTTAHRGRRTIASARKRGGPGVISPYVRRLRLARALQRLRDGRGMSAEQLARAVGVPRQRISGIENRHVQPDDNELIRILGALAVGTQQRTTILAVAADAR